mgnify:CR=1 FL=1
MTPVRRFRSLAACFPAHRWRLLKNAAGFSAASLINIATRAFYLILVARALSLEQFGYLVYAQSWYLVFYNLALFGLPTVVRRAFGLSPSEGEETLASAGALRLLMLGTALLVTSIAVLWVEDDPELIVVMLVCVNSKIFEQT